MNKLPTIAVLITCHNRKEKTLKCLSHLYVQKGFNEYFQVEVFLVDDGSTDGSSEAIQVKYPNVNFIEGNGNLYWNRGMRLAWQTAANSREFDYYLWLNDDTFLFEDALISLITINCKIEIISGTTRSDVDHRSTYGGYRRNPYRLLDPNGHFQECDFCNGNFLLISNEVFKIIGNLDLAFHHALGDFDYCYRAKKKGISILIGPNYSGICERHNQETKWKTASTPLFARLKHLYSPLSGCNPFEFFIIDSRLNGYITAIFHFITIHIRAIVPWLWKKI